MLFLSDVRPALTAKGFKPAEVMKEGAKQWKKLEDKSEYEQRAAQMKAEFLEKHPKPVKAEVSFFELIFLRISALRNRSNKKKPVLRTLYS